MGERGCWAWLDPALRVPFLIRLLHGDHADDPQRSSSSRDGDRPSPAAAILLGSTSSMHQPKRGALAWPRRNLYAAVAKRHGAKAVYGNRSARATLNGRGTSRPTIRSSRPRSGRTAPSGRSGCATRSPSRSTPPAAGCSSTTSGRTRGRRSTTASPGPTTAGRRRKARPPRRRFAARCMRIATTTRRCRARLPAERSTRR